MASHPQTAENAAIDLWVQMATQIISIIGVGGFNSLYARSLFLNQSSFPGLAASVSPLQTDQRFAELKKHFEGQSPAKIIEANNRLLCTFTDILAGLIGEALTSSILSSAWSDKTLLQGTGDRSSNE